MDATENATTLSRADGSTAGLSLNEVMDAIAHAHEESMDTDQTLEALRRAREEIETLKEALRTRTIIGQAVGLLMCESTLTADAAFAHLVATSSHTNVKLREIARSLVEQANDRAGAGQRLYPDRTPEPTS